MIHFQDNFYLTWNRNLVLILLFTWICRWDLSLGFVTWICLNLNWLLAVTGVMHEADDAYSIRSTWSCYWLDQFLTLALNILILSIFNISMDLSTNYFAHFSGCWASFACSCHYPRTLCHVFWSQVEYKIVWLLLPITWICQISSWNLDCRILEFYPSVSYWSVLQVLQDVIALIFENRPIQVLSISLWSTFLPQLIVWKMSKWL